MGLSNNLFIKKNYASTNVLNAYSDAEMIAKTCLKLSEEEGEVDVAEFGAVVRVVVVVVESLAVETERSEEEEVHQAVVAVDWFALVILASHSVLDCPA